tara:strand:+ start:665 stop:1222 length:558 start_codon:yes stop_codon:yes gene_type:complete
LADSGLGAHCELARVKIVARVVHAVAVHVDLLLLDIDHVSRIKRAVAVGVDSVANSRSWVDAWAILAGICASSGVCEVGAECVVALLSLVEDSVAARIAVIGWWNANIHRNVIRTPSSVRRGFAGAPTSHIRSGASTCSCCSGLHVPHAFEPAVQTATGSRRIAVPRPYPRYKTPGMIMYGTRRT